MERKKIIANTFLSLINPFATRVLGSMAGRSSDGGYRFNAAKFRDPILARLGRFAGRLGKSSAVVR